jgi:hypothetical protein
MQILTPEVIKQLNNLPGFPERPTTNPPERHRWILGDYLEEIRVRPGVQNLGELPLTDNTQGDVRIVIDEQAWYFWTGATWIPITGTSGGGVDPQIKGQDTSLLSLNTVCYVSGSNAWMPALGDGTLKQATSLGLYVGPPGTVYLPGAAADVLCTFAGGQPDNGAKLYLALASDDGGNGAGRVTATPPLGTPTGINLVSVGVCVDNSAYAADKKVKMVLEPDYPIVIYS